MSQTFDTIEELKDNSLINENTYLLLMNAMKRDFDRGRIVNKSETPPAPQPRTTPPAPQPRTTPPAPQPRTTPPAPQPRTIYDAEAALFRRPPCDLSVVDPNMKKMADAYNRAAERGRKRAAARRNM